MTQWFDRSVQPEPGRKIIGLWDDGSGAALLYVHDDGVIDQDGDDYDRISSNIERWAYLPDDFEFWCEHSGEEPMQFPSPPSPPDPAGSSEGER